MSMILVLTSISDPTAEEIFTNPPLLWRLLAPEDIGIYQRTLSEHNPPGFFRRLLGGSSTIKSSEIPTFNLQEWEGTYHDLDKAWHGIHYLLTKSAWDGEPPLNFLLLGGKEVPGVIVGNNPARFFSAVEVKLSSMRFQRLMRIT